MFDVTTFLLVLPWLGIAWIVMLMVRMKRASQQRVQPGDAFARSKWVLVTGAASGIGKAAALEILRVGGNVVACDINVAGMDEAFAGFKNDRVLKFKLDVVKQDDIDAIVRQLNASGVALFGLVNSAGVAVPPGQRRTIVKGASELNVDTDVLPVFGINLFGMMRVTSACFPLIIKSSGVIVNIASIAGRVAAPGMSVYAATKHAVVAYSSAMRRELWPYGIKVFSVEPGFTDTPLLASPLNAEGPDLTQTVLHETFKHMKTSGAVAKRFGPLQKAEDVGLVICSALFSQSWVPPHIVVDASKYYLFLVLGSLPSHWVDFAIRKLNELTASRRSGN